MYIKLAFKSFILLLAFVISGPMYAATQFRVIVDASGSMVISDPDKLTAESLRLIADLAPEKETTLGIWLFGEKPRVLLPDAAITPDNRKKLASYVDSYVTSDVKTDLEAIITLLLQEEEVGDNVQQHWILVTDGMVDISLDEKINEASRQRIKGDLLDALVERGIHLHTVSMTGYTDKALLESLSSKTDASHTEVALPEDLLPTFNKIFSLSSESDQIPFEGNTFFVDESIDEFTLLVFHAPGQEPILINSKNIQIDLNDATQARRVNGSHYSLITVTNPLAGTWKVDNINIDQSTIRVITDLSAKASKVPAVLFQNEPFFTDIGLYQEGELIQDTDFLNLVRVKKTLNKNNGEVNELIQQFESVPLLDSKYKSQFNGLLTIGNYELDSFVDGGSFARKLIQHFSVVSPVSLEIQVSDVGIMTYSVKPTNLRLNVLRSRLMLEVTSSDGVISEEELPVIGQGYWQKVDFNPEKVFSARVRLEAITQTGVNFTYWSNYWDIDSTNTETRIVERLDELGKQISIAQFESDSRDVMSVFSPSELIVSETVVDDNEKEIIPVENELTEPDKDKKQSDNQNSETDELITEKDVMFYAGINLVVIVLIGLGYFVYRRRKNAKTANTQDGNH